MSQKHSFTSIFMKETLVVIVLLMVNQCRSHTPGISARDINNVLNSTRIELGNYKLVMYRQKKDTLLNISILDRSIQREKFNELECLKIVEAVSQTASRNKTIIYINAGTLKPLHYEYYSNDTLI